MAVEFLNNRRRLLSYIGLGAAGLLVTIVLAGVIAVIAISSDLPSVETLKNYQPPVTTRVYAGDGTLLGEYARERRIFVPISFVPKRVIQAFTSAEDKNFYNHPGIDPSGIMRAAAKDVVNVLQGKRLEGASTITQQVAKNFLLNSEVKFSRKIKEAILAVRIDATYPKQKILELYLNEIFLGENSYGVAAAALNYFDKSLDELTIADAAFLAALPKAPSNYNPKYRYKAALDRRNWVIGQMEENGYITDAEAKEAIATPLVTQMRPMGIQAEDADYFVEEIRRILYAKYGEKALYDGGLQVRSTLDTRLQNFAVNALRIGLVRYDHRHGWRGALSNIGTQGDWKSVLTTTGNQSGIETWRIAVVLGYGAGKSITIGLADGSRATIPFSEIAWAKKALKDGYTGAPPQSPQDVVKPGDVIYVEPADARGNYGLRQIPKVNGAIVVIDPHTGRVLALSGGFSFASSQYDRAMQAQRQPGSAFKPFVLAAALDNGYTPISTVVDGPFSAPQGPGLPMWTPKNFEKSFLGPITLRRTIVLSRNLATIRLASQVGMQTVAQYPVKMGVYDKLPAYLSNAIGAAETTLMRLTLGYAEFVNGGRKVSASLIDRIQDRNGVTVYRHDERDCSSCNQPDWRNQSEPMLEDPRAQILDPRTAYQVVSIMQGVVEYGTGKTVSQVKKPLAGKTGTSNDAKDVWFVGFSPDLVCGVFVGYDDPVSLGHHEQGATIAAPVFRDFMQDALATALPTPFRVPAGIVLVHTNRISGQQTGAGDPLGIDEAFKAGTEPGVAQGPIDETITDHSGPGTDVGEGTGGLY